MRETSGDAFAWLSDEERRGARTLRWTTHPAGVIPLDVGELGSRCPDFLIRSIEEALRGQSLGYAPSVRKSDYAQFVVEFHAREFRWSFDRSRVVPIANVLASVSACLSDLPAGGVLLLGPAYPGLYEAVVTSGRRLTRHDLTVEADGSIDLGLDQLSLEVVRDLTAVVFSYPHSPTGRLFDDEILESIVRFAEAGGISLIVDEVYGPLVFHPERYVPIGKASAGRCRVYSVGSSSKAWNLGSFKAGWVVCPDSESAARVARLPVSVAGQLGAVSLLVGCAALSMSSHWLSEARSQLRLNAEAWISVLDATDDRFAVCIPESGMFVWMAVPKYIRPMPISSYLLREARVALSAGATYGSAFRNHVRVNIGIEQDVLRRGARACVQALGGSGA
jgi:cysteine-S-conjugate beta-lyase